MVFVRVLALNTEVTCSFRQLVLRFALLLNGGVCGFNGVHHLVFAHFAHFAFHHDNAVHAARDHDVHVRALQLRTERVDDERTIHARNAHLRNGAVKWNVTYCDTGRSGEARQAVWQHFFISRHQLNHDLRSCVVIAWERWAQGPVNQAHDQYFRIRRTCLTLEETAGETSCSCVFFSVIDCQWQEVDVVSGVVSRNCCCQ